MADQRNLNLREVEALAVVLCLILVPDEIGMTDEITENGGWAEEIYFGRNDDLPGEASLRRPKASKAIQKFMKDNDLTDDEIIAILAEVEKYWPIANDVQ